MVRDYLCTGVERSASAVCDVDAARVVPATAVRRLATCGCPVENPNPTNQQNEPPNACRSTGRVAGEGRVRFFENGCKTLASEVHRLPMAVAWWYGVQTLAKPLDGW